MKIRFILNGKQIEKDVDPSKRVLDLLREEKIFSVKDGCSGEGYCGSCAILLDGKIVNSCLLLAPQIDGKKIETIENISSHNNLHPIQQAFIKSGIVQCGYCTPAMELAIKNLLDKNPNPTKEEIKDAVSGVFCRCTGYQQIFEAVEIAKKLIEKQKVESPEKYGGEDLIHIGRRKDRVDGPILVRGEPAFVEDKLVPGTLYIKLLLSPYPHAIIKDIDTSEAEKIPGVEYILTYKNSPDVIYSSAGQNYPEPSPYDRKLIDRKVRHVGDRVAAVAATSLEIAEEAIKKIKVEYEELPAVFTIEEASKEGAPLVHENRDVSLDPLPIGAEPNKNIAAHNEGGIGDIEKGFKEADVIIERRYKTSPVQCVPLEPHVAHTYIENNRLVIRASTQVPWHLRRVVAKILGISENKIRVIKERVGGGFGCKQDIVVEDIAAWITWQTGKPAFIRYNREEEFIASRIRHVMDIKVKLGAKKDGKLTAMEMEVLANTGAYGVHCLTVPMNACSKSLPLFKCDNVRYSVTAYYTNLPMAGAYQGYGAPQGSFAVQVAAAELSEKLNIDFYEFLEKNRVTEGYRLEILKCLGEGQEGIPQEVSTCGLGEALKRAHEYLKWGQKEESKDKNIKIGKGIAIIQQGTGLPGIDSANAELKMMWDGTFMLLIGGTDLGTGLDTVAVKMVAETLKIDMDDVSLIAADTDVTPFDVGAYASSGTYFSGGSAYKAAEKMKQEILKVASEMLKESIEDLEIKYRGKVVSKKTGKEVTYAQISAYTHGGTGKGQLITNACFTTDEAPIPYAVHCAQVSIDTRTGKIKIDKYLAVHDCGIPVNPELALGQIYGGVMKAVGHSLFEEMIFDEKGRCLNPDLLDYKVPMINDLPEELKAEILEIKDPLGPYGVKSVSEISMNGTAPAIAIAIHDALGIWIREWPFKPEKILKEIKEIKR